MNTHIHPHSLRRALPFGRLAKSILLAKGDLLGARAYAEGQAWSDTPSVAIALRAAVAALSNPSALSYTEAVAGEFLSLVRARSILGRVTGLRRVPMNTSMLRVTGGPAASWVGQGIALPISKFSLERDSLGIFKIGAAVVVTDELMLAAGEVADLAFTSELIRAVAAFEDRSFLDPGRGAVADTAPASITAGLTPIASTGSSADEVRADVARLFAAFDAADGAFDTAYIAMHPRTAVYMGQLTTTNGGLLYPHLGARGGDVLGVPVLVSSALELVNSPGETFMTMFDPSQVLFGDDENVSIDVATHASIQLDDAPSPGAQQLVSLWENGLRALKLVRACSWKLTSGAGAAVLTEITY
ncbi:MAG: phage major capsid protein [Betaproteobacteria bacterium]